MIHIQKGIIFPSAAVGIGHTEGQLLVLAHIHLPVPVPEGQRPRTVLIPHTGADTRCRRLNRNGRSIILVKSGLGRVPLAGMILGTEGILALTPILRTDNIIRPPPIGFIKAGPAHIRHSDAQVSAETLEPMRSKARVGIDQRLAFANAQPIDRQRASPVRFRDNHSNAGDIAQDRRPARPQAQGSRRRPHTVELGAVCNLRPL